MGRLYRSRPGECQLPMQDTRFDLDAYLARIGLHRPAGTERDVLRAIVAHHSAAIPFESIDAFLGRGIRIDPEALTDKLVRRRRGGYCFEQNLLLLSALRALGFDAAPRLARVLRGHADDAMTPRTHVVLRVALTDGACLADVGFGNLTPTTPLTFEIDAPQPTGHERFRIVPMGTEWLVQADLNGAWQTLYRLGPETPAPIDLEVANWFTATHPASPFTGNLIIARPAPGERRTLFNNRFAVRGAQGVQVTYPASPAELRSLLAEAFNLALDEADITALAAAIRDRPQDTRFQAYFS